MRLVTQRNITALVGFAGFMTLLTAQSDYPDFLGRYSWRYVATLGAYAAIFGIALFLLSRRLPTFPDWLVLLGAAGSLLLIAWLPLLAHTWYLNTTLKLSFTWLVIVLVMHSRSVVRHWQAAVLSLLVFIQAVSILTLENYPDMHISDEGWGASVGWTFAQERIMYSGVNQGVFGVPERFVPVANVLPGYWFEAAGVGLFQARLLSFFGGILFLAAMYVAAHRLYRDRDTALFATLAVAVTYPFLLNNHYFRLEAYLGTAMALSLYLYLRAETAPRLGILSGFVLASAVELHQNAIFLCMGSGLFLVLWAIYRRRHHQPLLQSRDLYFVLGGILGSLLFVGFHILPDPGAFIEQLGNSTQYRQEVYSADNYDEWGPLRVVVRILKTYKEVSPVEMVVVLAIVTLALRRNPERVLLLVMACILLMFTIFAPTYHDYYLIYLSPFLGLMLAGIVKEWIRSHQAAALVVCLAVLMPMAWIMFKADHKAKNARLLSAFDHVAATLDADERVAAPQIFFFVTPNNPNLMALFMPRYAYMTDENVDKSTVWGKYHPDVFILYGPEEDQWGEIYRDQEGFVVTEQYDDPNLPYDVIVYRRPTKAHSGE